MDLRPIDGVDNPVVTAADVTDFGSAHFVADPFLLAEGNAVHLFFEVFNRNRTPTAAIGHATSPDGGRTWAYDRIVLAEPVHLSFPYVFAHGGDHYMIPDKWMRERGEAAPIELYRARRFPTAWEPVATIAAPDDPLHDCVVFRREGRWWALAGDGTDLHVFVSADLERDGWRPHPDNPVVSDRPTAARPGGRPVVRPDHVLAYFQDCAGAYGRKLRAYRITTLTEDRYEDREVAASPVLEGSSAAVGWNSGRMHHADPLATDGGWLCAVDGNVGLRWGVFGKYHWAIGMYGAAAPQASTSTPPPTPSGGRRG